MQTPEHIPSATGSGEAAQAAQVAQTAYGAVFDADILGNMFDRDFTLISGMLRTFIASTNTGLAEIAHAAAAQDLATVASLAHRIAGASRLSGALALGQLAADVEQAAKRGDIAAVTNAPTQLQAHWSLVQIAIGPLPLG